MPFFIVTEQNLILPGEFDSYEFACNGCDAGDTIFIADSRKMLEDTLDAEIND